MSAMSQAPDEVRPGLFLGGYFALRHCEELGVTHILSIVNGEMSRNMCVELIGPVIKPMRHHVDISDVETANLLVHLPGCVDFIRGALEGGGKVLVHCAAGVSRSSTAVSAYIMVDQQMDAELALKYVQMKHPPAWPNEGFRYQLKLFEDMGCKLDPEYDPFKRFLLSTMTQQDVANQASLPAPQAAAADGPEKVTYRCRKCRTLVATSDNIVDVEAGPGDSAFDWRKRLSGGGGTPALAAETAVWVVPLRWMEGILGEVQGKLNCPKCSARLGSFNWSGMQSRSGRWVTPAFQLHTARLDAESAGGLGAFAGLKIAQPKGVASAPSSAPQASSARPANQRRRSIQGRGADDAKADADDAALEDVWRRSIDQNGTTRHSLSSDAANAPGPPARAPPVSATEHTAVDAAVDASVSDDGISAAVADQAAAAGSPERQQSFGTAPPGDKPAAAIAAHQMAAEAEAKAAAEEARSKQASGL